MYSKKPQGWKKHTDFILLDVLSLHIAFVLAYMTRHGWDNPYAKDIYANIIVVYTLVDVTMLVLNNRLTGVLRRGHYKEFAETAKHVFLVELIVTFYLFSTQDGDAYSRITIYLLAIYYLVIAFGIRELWKHLLKKRHREAAISLFLITTADRAESTVREFTRHNHQYLLQGICLLNEDGTGREICGIPVTANEENVLEYLCNKWVDEVYIAFPVGSAYPQKLVDSLAEMGIVVHIEMPNIADEGWHQIVEKIGNHTVCTVGITMTTPQQLVMKRLLDIAGGLVGCLITGLLTLIIGPMICIKSPGPIFFAQTRVGRHGKKFKMYKFRSMYPDAEERKAELMKENRVKDGMMFKLEYDPRIIGCERRPDGTVKKGIGNFIRDWSLDEFPQFFNVLKGDLSLCGTRPPTVDEWEKYELRHRVRLAIKPGITGLWQISGRSNITDFEQVVELDKKYIREWSMGLDMRILFKTVLVVLGKEGSM